jgi:hypothetical protein
MLDHELEELAERYETIRDDLDEMMTLHDIKRKN